jgi:alanine racemase
MDQIMLDVTHVPSVAIGDEAVLFGTQSGAKITIDEVAKKIGTISYEVVCSISARVPRVYIDGDQGSIVEA